MHAGDLFPRRVHGIKSLHGVEFNDVPQTYRWQTSEGLGSARHVCIQTTRPSRAAYLPNPTTFLQIDSIYRSSPSPYIPLITGQLVIILRYSMIVFE